MVLTKKQTIALDYLEDYSTEEIYFGGAAGGGKSDIGCYFELKRRLKYPGTRGLIGRASFKTLKDTTLQTFFDRAKQEGLKRGLHFDLTSAQDKEFANCLVFDNRSVIYLRDLYAYPQDPDFDELGSLELTDAYVDEAPQITDKAKNVLKSRIRYRLTETGLLIPKLFLTGNPSKNWAYSDFYRPSKEGTLREDRKFIQALPGDNPHLPESYLKSLAGLDKNSRERLLYGNWEYDDDPAALIDYDKILDCFTNSFVDKGEGYITCDVARFGADSTVIGLWEGWRVKLYQYKGYSVQQTADRVNDLRLRHNVPLSRVIFDEDGVGGGCVDILKGCKGFVNNSKALPNPITRKDDNYANLKSQCYYRLAERINAGGVYVDCEDITVKKLIIQELEQVKQHNMDKDGKRQIIPKDKVKEIIGRSPDFSDTLMMREWFDLAFKFKVVVA
jgi:phage terminase large subunit